MALKTAGRVTAGSLIDRSIVDKDRNDSDDIDADGGSVGMTERHVQQWTDDKVDICNRIASTKSRMKILLKTRDDPYFLEQWVRHHESICGRHNIIICDNCSTNATVLDYYQKLGLTSTVFSFDGFHDNVHHTGLFPELYAVLRETCAYYIFLDTDEFLTRIVDDRHSAGPDILDAIEARIGSGVLSGTWLPDVLESRTQFWIGNNHDILRHGLEWGKPIVSTTRPITGFTNHNCQIRDVLGPPAPCNEFFVLHMDSLYPQQRVAINILKLQKMGVLKADCTLSDALTVDSAGITDGNALLYLSQIKGFSALSETANPYKGRFPEGSLELAADHLVRYSSDVERAVMAAFQASPGLFQIG